ncbi:MAG: hypothetical protein B6D64_00950 [Bacteroidetes bacterium 4484_276]|nr:MAG: hypothetical protein B6D64_00950 [Bacteroidetes bacterium 4484_276]
MDLLQINRHWQSNFRYNFTFERKQFKDLLNHIDKPQITELTGLRRTGKTTMFLQTINHLLDKNVDPFKIWYFTFDLEEQNLESLFRQFEVKTGNSIQKHKIFIFLDEIQKLEKFELQLKVFYDLYPNLKFFISGSTSLFIKKKSRESLAGRILPSILPVLSFREYLDFTGKGELVERPDVYEQDLIVEYEKYWGCQLIETVQLHNRNDRNEYYETILRKIIFEDIPKIATVEYPEILYRLVKILANFPGMYLNYDNLANDLNISSKTISKYFSLLEEAFLVKVLYNFSNNLLTTEKKMKRAYLTSVSFTQSLAENINSGHLAENAFLSQNNFKFFWRNPYKNEVDFVGLHGKKAIPVEVKYKKEVNYNDLKNLFLFSKKFKIEKPVCLLKNSESKTVNYKGLDICLESVYLFGMSL